VSGEFELGRNVICERVDCQSSTGLMYLVIVATGISVHVCL